MPSFAVLRPRAGVERLRESLRDHKGKSEARIRVTFTGLESIRSFPQDFASSGRAPESDPSNSCPVLMKTEKSAPFLIRLALRVWCFTMPPPRMMTPDLRAFRD